MATIRPIRVDHTDFFKWLLKLFNFKRDLTTRFDNTLRLGSLPIVSPVSLTFMKSICSFEYHYHYHRFIHPSRSLTSNIIIVINCRCKINYHTSVPLIFSFVDLNLSNVSLFFSTELSINHFVDSHSATVRTVGSSLYETNREIYHT